MSMGIGWVDARNSSGMYGHGFGLVTFSSSAGWSVRDRLINGDWPSREAAKAAIIAALIHHHEAILAALNRLETEDQWARAEDVNA